MLTEDEMRTLRGIAKRMIDTHRGSCLIAPEHVGLVRLDLDPWSGEQRSFELRLAAKPEDFEPPKGEKG